jgi:5-methylcytosine-specific restriction endonuclease McrA
MTTPFPQKLGHNYTFVQALNMDLLHSKYATHRRLRVFHHKGLACAGKNCSKKGMYLIKAQNTSGGFHLDIYTDDFELMTIDHIIPKSKGGTDQIENLQPMCHTCNYKKADKHEAL